MKREEIEKLKEVIGLALGSEKIPTVPIKHYAEVIYSLISAYESALKVIEFYANIENFNFLQTDQNNIYFVEGLDESKPIPSVKDCDEHGKRAREFLKLVE